MYKESSRTVACYDNDRGTLPDDILENAVKMEYRHQMLRWPFLVIC